jgi:hypothetical protein
MRRCCFALGTPVADVVRLASSQSVKLKLWPTPSLAFRNLQAVMGNEDRQNAWYTPRAACLERFEYSGALAEVSILITPREG